jgi:hypothetical protein
MLPCIAVSATEFRASIVRGSNPAVYLFGLPDWLSTFPEYPLLRPHSGGDISNALCRDDLVEFFTRDLRGRRRRAGAVSTILFAFVDVFHVPCYSALQTAAIRQTQTLAAQCRASWRRSLNIVIADRSRRLGEIEVAAPPYSCRISWPPLCCRPLNSKDQYIGSQTKFCPLSPRCAGQAWTVGCRSR